MGLTDKMHEAQQAADGGNLSETVALILDEIAAIATGQRRLIEDLSLRIEDLEYEQIQAISRAIETDAFLRKRAPGWVSNDEFRAVAGKHYRTTRAVLYTLGRLESKRVREPGKRGTPALLVRSAEGGKVGRLSRRALMEAMASNELL